MPTALRAATSQTPSSIIPKIAPLPFGSPAHKSHHAPLAINSTAPTIPHMSTATETADTMASLLRLPKKRKMEIAERLWLSVTDERTARVPAVHKQIVSTRLADYRSGKTVPIPHAEFMRKLRAK